MYPNLLMSVETDHNVINVPNVLNADFCIHLTLTKFIFSGSLPFDQHIDINFTYLQGNKISKTLF